MAIALNSVNRERRVSNAETLQRLMVFSEELEGKYKGAFFLNEAIRMMSNMNTLIKK